MDENYVTGDAETALANYIAVKDFFRQFPEYAHHEFYISGKSGLEATPPTPPHGEESP